MEPGMGCGLLSVSPYIVFSSVGVKDGHGENCTDRRGPQTNIRHYIREA
jgi:hypothetical protein